MTHFAHAGRLSLHASRARRVPRRTMGKHIGPSAISRRRGVLLCGPRCSYGKARKVGCNFQLGCNFYASPVFFRRAVTPTHRNSFAIEDCELFCCQPAFGGLAPQAGRSQGEGAQGSRRRPKGFEGATPLAVLSPISWRQEMGGLRGLSGKREKKEQAPTPSLRKMRGLPFCE